MLIKFKTKNITIPLYLPNLILKSKYIINKISKNGFQNNWIINVYPHIKKYIKKYGHFNLIEIFDHKNKVSIIVKI